MGMFYASCCLVGMEGNGHVFMFYGWSRKVTRKALCCLGQLLPCVCAAGEGMAGKAPLPPHGKGKRQVMQALFRSSTSHLAFFMAILHSSTPPEGQGREGLEGRRLGRGRNE